MSDIQQHDQMLKVVLPLISLASDSRTNRPCKVQHQVHCNSILCKNNCTMCKCHIAMTETSGAEAETACRHEAHLKSHIVNARFSACAEHDQPSLDGFHVAFRIRVVKQDAAILLLLQPAQCCFRPSAASHRSHMLLLP